MLTSIPADQLTTAEAVFTTTQDPKIRAKGHACDQLYLRQVGGHPVVLFDPMHVELAARVQADRVVRAKNPEDRELAQRRIRSMETDLKLTRRSPDELKAAKDGCRYVIGAFPEMTDDDGTAILGFDLETVKTAIRQHMRDEQTAREAAYNAAIDAGQSVDEATQAVAYDMDVLAEREAIDALAGLAGSSGVCLNLVLLQQQALA
ncbi:MAG TPA: hypothetical protein VFN80_03265 [Acidothermaceae bacterium]|nr:hypothetical protein [Acidothermaceae bacterium]